MPASAFRKQARVSVQEISLSLKPILPWFCKSSVSIAATVDAMSVVIFAFHRRRCMNPSMPVAAKQPTAMTVMAARVLKAMRRAVCTAVGRVFSESDGLLPWSTMVYPMDGISKVTG